MTASKVIYECDGSLARIKLNDPAVRNAMDLQMAEELAEALVRAARDARALVLTGEGRAFCAGANISSGRIAGETDGQPDVGATLETHTNPLMLALRDLPIPLITAVRGAAAGVGCSLALAGDIIIVSESAVFVQAFINIALVPDGGSTWLLSRAIGRVRTMEMILMGEKLPAARALDWGLVTRMVPDDQLDATATAMAMKLATGPTRSIAMVRRMAWRAADDRFEDVLKQEREMQRAAGLTADHAEGMAAFLAKRPAQFTGN